MPTNKKSTTSKVTITHFGLQANTDRTVFVTWSWTKKHTKHYQYIWYYNTGDGVWLTGENSTTTNKQSVYNAPNNATQVKVKIKPVSTTYKDKKTKKEVSYWTGSWCSEKTYTFPADPPDKPSVPTVSIDHNIRILTASVNNITTTGNTNQIEFQIVKDNSVEVADWWININSGYASIAYNVALGASYKVRCRAYSAKTGLYSDWSEYSDNYQTGPVAVSGISLSANSETSVSVTWTPVPSATSYYIEYTTNISYFDSNASEVKNVTIDGTYSALAIVTGLESGNKYFFRLRSINSAGHSTWTAIKEIIVGKNPASPTTWSSSTSISITDPLTLYWNHNSEDGSSITKSSLALTVNGSYRAYELTGNGAFKIDSSGNLSKISSYIGDDKDKTTSCYIDVSGYSEGAKIQWKVRTAGITAEYGDWSIERKVDVYAHPTLELILWKKIPTGWPNYDTSNMDGEQLRTLTSFPFFISGIAGPSTQKVLGYYVTITADSSYQTVNQIGEETFVNKGESLYSKYFDTYDDLLLEISAGNIDLENNISYTVSCIATMDTGLTAESSAKFKVAWTDEIYEPNAETAIVEDDVSVLIHPYCKDEYENLIEGVTLSVYRREFDGDFVLLSENIDNMTNTWTPDPHPALDYARYRIVAKSNSTGSISYYDMPGLPIGETCVIIQWDEKWSTYNSTIEEDVAEPVWSGSMLKLPYNIDVSESNDADVSLVSYMGRKHPVSYYGTKVGTKSIWNVDIEKDDEETIYALRRLAVYMGDVYVREPSGLGYWANIKVSFSQKHCELTIPVTLDITRVEGGA